MTRFIEVLAPHKQPDWRLNLTFKLICKHVNTSTRNYSFSFAAFLVLSISILSACSSQPHEPIAAHDENWMLGDWQLYCEFASYDGQNSNSNHASWVWGLDSNLNTLHLNGKLSDGFFKLENKLSISLNQACLRASPSTPKKPAQLVRFQAARAYESIPVNIIQTEQSNTNISQIVVFGDSLSDAGQLKQRLKIFPNNPYWLGRFSNGPIWTNYFEHAFNISIQNRAFAGAFTEPPIPLEQGSWRLSIKQQGQLKLCGSLEQQVDDFINKALNKEPLTSPNNTLFLLWPSANDYVAKEPISGVIDIFLNEPDSNSGYQTIVQQAMISLSEQAVKLYQQGARYIAFFALPDMGLTPIVMQNSSFMVSDNKLLNNERRELLSQRLSALTAAHNEALENTAEQLQQRYPELKLLISHAAQDLHKAVIKSDINQSDNAFGFELSQRQAISPKVNSAIIQPRCYRGGYLGSSNPSEVCSYPEKAFFWDVAHPTTYAHCWQSLMLYEELLSKGWVERRFDHRHYQSWCEAIGKRLKSPNSDPLLMAPEL